jgi:hypothetical protein
MAISRVRTILALDEWAEIMELPGWLFNQVLHPVRVQRGGEMWWHQSGYYSDPNRIAGRDSVARAIATAERKIADHLGYWPAPVWTCGEQHDWPVPERGSQRWLPELKTNWGYLLAAGEETWAQLNIDPVGVVYSDEDGDGVEEWATITFAPYIDITNVCEVEVVPPNRNPAEREWRIRPLEASLDAGVLTIQGPKWLFVNPDVWLTIESIGLDGTPPDFLASVDLYRHYNDTTGEQAEYMWVQNPCSTQPCREICQNACVKVMRRRTGHFVAETATYSPSSGQWVSATWSVQATPNQVRIWYYSGYTDYSCYGCERLPMSLKEAIVRLANVYLPETPCGKGFTRERWEHDREEMDMNNYDVALAQSAFGTTARGAVFARSVCATLEPLGKGG